MPRAALASALWPDERDPDARANLRRHLFRLTRALPEATEPWILGDAQTVGWNHAAGATIDLVEFSRLVEAGRERDAVELYTGHLLASSYDDAIVVERERLRGMYLDALEHAARAARTARDFSGALRYAELLLGVDEWREDAVRAVMTARYRSGDRSGALAAYERFAQSVQRELGISPMVETTALRDAILAGALPDEAVAQEAVARETGVPFVGRSGELQEIRSAWLRAARGHGTTIFIAGEPGIGKSRLAHELCATVEAQGGRALVGRTAHPEAGAFQVVIEALRDGLSLLTSGDLDPAWLAAISPLMPEIARVHGDVAYTALDPERSRLRLREAFVRLATAIARRKPVAIVFEDVHWAGTETLELIDALARRVAGLPVVLLLTYHSGEVGAAHPLQITRRRLQQERRGQTITLARLHEDELGALAKELIAPAPVPAGLVRHVYEVSEGNPLFAVQLLRFYTDTGEMPSAERALSSVGDAVLSRVERLPEASRRIAGFSALFGSTFTVEELARVSGWEESTVLDALGILLDGKIVCERGGERFAYGFTHALIETAIRNTVPAADLRVRHRRIAEVLAHTRAGDAGAAALIASHWELGGEPARAAGAYLRAAQAATQRFAQIESIALARRAVALGLDDENRFEALRTIVTAAWGLGELTTIRPDLEQLGRLAKELGVEYRVTALMLRVRIAERLGDVAEYQRAVDALTEFAEASGRDDWQAEAHLALAYHLFGCGLLVEAEMQARVALEFALRSADSDVVIRVRSVLIQNLLRQGKIREGTAAVEEIRKEAEESADLKLHHLLVTSQLRLASATENLELRRSAGDRALEIAEQLGDIHSALVARSERAYAAHQAWDSAEARRLFEKTGAQAHELGFTRYWLTNQINLGCVERELGHFERAVALWTAARPVARRANSGASLACCAINLAEAELERGSVRGALTEGRAGLKLAEKTGELRFVAEAEVLLGAAECAAGKAESGLARMRKGLALRRTLDSPRTLAVELCRYCNALLDANRLDDGAAVAAELRALYDADPEHQTYPGKVCLTLARAAVTRGDAAGAAKLRRRGRKVLEDTLARLSDPADRAAFAGLAENRELLSG
jgi:DNA-binding SARP family transcriptional activator